MNNWIWHPNCDSHSTMRVSIWVPHPVNYNEQTLIFTKWMEIKVEIKSENFRLKNHTRKIQSPKYHYFVEIQCFPKYFRKYRISSN